MRLSDWIRPVPEPLGGDGRWHSGHLWSGRDPATPRFDLGGSERAHVGLDIAGILGSDLIAPADGQVEALGFNSGAGNWITTRHQVRWGRTTRAVWARQCHCLAQRLVSEGQTIVQGQPIALLGSTGSSASPHDHTSIMLTPELPSWTDRSLFLDPEPIYYPGAYEFMQQGHPYPNEVRRLQKRLNQVGCLPALMVDGDYGPGTAAAVRWWQQRQGLEPHGAASELVLALLFAARGKEA
jgi:murein DD-endopeptidase MepM/ murein hydrolase activator NlpD